jgi:radical SAM superfamily enzyme YgiQ (UPF0313 family)
VKLLLVAAHPAPSPQSIPLANGFLKGFVNLPHCEIILQELFIDQQPQACATSLAAFKSDAVGFSVYAWNRLFCLETARLIKNLLPEIKLFAGGPEVTADYDRLLDCGVFDFLIVGEGELPFQAACQRLSNMEPLDQIPGVATRVDGLTTLIPAGPVKELDQIPSPYLSGVLDCSQYQGVLWQLARGCAFSCDFCFDSRDRHGVRRFSLKRIEAELRHFASTGVSQVFVLDSTFNQDLARAKTILRLIRKIAPQIHFHFEVRSEFIDQELAELFAAITCSLQIGLQSADPEILKAVGRNFRKEDFISRIGLLNNSGATFGFDLIFGLPGDTPERFSNSLDFSLSLYPNHLDIFPLSVLPGTALAKRAKEAGLAHLNSPPYTLLSSNGFSKTEMAAARQLANSCDIFYTRGRAVAWFNGVIATLGIKPSKFLKEFGNWLELIKTGKLNEADLSDNEIWMLQRQYLEKVFIDRHLQNLLPLALDLVDYHYHYAAALMTPPPQLTGKKRITGARLPETRWQLSRSARLAPFNYEILELLEAGAPDLRRWSKQLKMTGSFAIIYAHPEGVFTESVAEPYFRLLEQLDGVSNAAKITAKLGISKDEAIAFLDFAASEGIITTPSS